MRTPALLRSMAIGLLGTILIATPARAEDEPFSSATAAPQVLSGPDSPDNDLAPSWTFSAPDVGSFECSLSRDDTVVGDWAPCSSPTAYDLSAHPDGLYTFAVRVVGLDGSVSDPVTSPYELDTRVPGLPTITELPGPAAADLTPSWTFTGGTSESLECRLDRGTDEIAGWAPCRSPQEFDLTGQPDGGYSFSVRGVGKNGARGPARTDGYLLDTAPPAAPAISSPPPAIGRDRSVKVAFSAEAGTPVECRVGDDAWRPCTSPHAFDLSGLADGRYTLGLRATDAAGNTGAVATAEHTLDTTAPDPPAVEAPAVTPATKLQPTFRFAASAGAAYECRLDGPGGYATGWQACASPVPYDLTGQPNGLYAFSVRGTDTAGNTGDAGTAAYELIRNPRAVDLRSGPGRVGNALRPRWTFEDDSAASFKCSLVLGTTELFKPATCGSPRTYNLTGRPDGVYTFTVQATAKNGELREPASQDYELDSTPPAEPSVESTPVSPAPDHTPAWRFSGDDGAALDCRVTRDGETVVDWTGCTNPKPFDLGDAGDGDYRVTVRARDAAGNLSAAKTTDYELDSTAPAAPTITDAPNAEDVNRSPTWSFAGEKDAVFTCTLTRGTQVISTESSCADTKTYNLTGEGPGSYTFTVAATDAAGNTGPAKTERYLLAKAPAKSGGSGSTGSGSSPGPGSGPAAGGGSPGGGLTPGGTTDDGGGDSSGAIPAAGPAAADGGSSESPVGSGTREPTAGSGTRAPANSSGANPNPSHRRGTAAPSAPGADTAAAGRAPVDRARDALTRARDHNGSASDANPRDRDRRNGRAGHGLADKVEGAADGIRRGTARAVTGRVGRAVFPMSLLIVLGGFLLVQGRIDRDDPKLAMAPIDAEPALEFEPPPTRR